MRDRLLIKKIEISNYGGFDGEHIIELSSESKKNFTIIIGTSGRGKSTIFQLVHWCLYGKHFDKKDEDTATDEGIINLPQLESLEDGEKVTGKVTLQINNQDGEKYVLERIITAQKHSEESKTKFDENNNSKIDAGIQTETSCKLKMKDKDGNDKWEKNKTIIDSEIRKHLPQALKDFFLFDGEKLVNFRSKTGSSRLIQDGIEKISGLTILDSLIDHVKYSKTKISSSISGKEVTSKSLSRKVYDLNKELDAFKKDKEDKEKLRNDQNALLEQVIVQIASSGEGKRIEDQIKDQNKILKSNKKDQKKNDNETHDFIFEKLPLLLISDTLYESENSFVILEKLNLIPPSITREALDKIFNEKSCVCGRGFKENDNVWERLDEIKKAVLDKDTTSGITQGRTVISQMFYESDITDVKTKFNELQNTSSDLDRVKQEANAKKDELFADQQEITGVKGVNYDELIQIRKDSHSDIAGLNTDIRSLDEDIIDTEEKRNAEDKKLTIRLQHEGKYNKELTKIVILKAVEKYSKEKRTEIIETLRAQTEEYTGRYFKSSAPQASEFADLPPKGAGPVKISSNYDISAVNNEGREKSLSKGQAHVLGLSYVSGCRQITSSDTFLFIDSPLHNISGDSRNEVANVLQEHLPDVQIVLFVTDTEYTSGDPEGAKAVREYLNPQTKVWKEWIINVTCTECKDKILFQSEENLDELVCKNCNKIYVKKSDPTGRRLITEFDRNV